MFVHYRTQGLILKKEDQGEADQLFTVYTKDFGKLTILGKAIRKISSKLRSGIELFYLSEIEFIQGKTHKTLTDAILIESFSNLRKNLIKLTVASKISKVLDYLVRSPEPDEKIWSLLKEVFYKLDTLEVGPYRLELIYYYFLWNLLSILGYQPELYHCPLCQKKISSGKIFFSPKEGGIICQKCSQLVKLNQEVSPEVIKILRIIFQKDWKILLRLKVKKVYLKSLAKIAKVYLKEGFS